MSRMWTSKGRNWRTLHLARGTCRVGCWLRARLHGMKPDQFMTEDCSIDGSLPRWRHVVKPGHVTLELTVLCCTANQQKQRGHFGSGLCFAVFSVCDSILVYWTIELIQFVRWLCSHRGCLCLRNVTMPDVHHPSQIQQARSNVKQNWFCKAGIQLSFAHTW